MPAGGSQRVVKPELLGLGDAPGCEPLAAHPIPILRRALEHENRAARAREHRAERAASDASTHHDHVDQVGHGASQEATLGGGPKKPVMRRRRPSSASSPKSMPSVTIVPSPARSAQVKRIAP
jgi:hypothetical protein